MPPTVLLPPEILGKIVEIAADYKDNSVALSLCFVSQLFYQRAMSRLYHTLSSNDKEKLAMILHTSVPLRPWIASCVRVLNLLLCPPSLASQAIRTFRNIRSLCLPIDAALDPETFLPDLRCLHMSSTGIPTNVAQNITHLNIFGPTYDVISHLMKRKEEFHHLTHFLVQDSSPRLYLEGSLGQAMDLLHESLPSHLPPSLKVFIINNDRFNYGRLNFTPKLKEKVQQVMALDHRIVFWNQEPGTVPLDWKGPRICDFQSNGLLIEHSLGALPDGVVGIWEYAEMWIQENVKFF
ncbi:hypothetical protein DL96DRAFT_1613252 [Flagelloscypha sp. PMI_526]|nr:hypothetical protein DL96DRAFT_1613252 [Flagelloscypha sp. PMI_526]